MAPPKSRDERDLRPRLDTLLVDRGLLPTREKSRALIMAGEVLVDGEPVVKSGTRVKRDSEIVILDKTPRYVSRGGIKLEAALSAFSPEVEGKVALDVGASTGGFTDCLLKFGAAHVYALDVGYGQLDWRLRNDPRVTVLERKNIRSVKKADFDRNIELIVIDVSFISLKKVIPVVRDILNEGGSLIALIKPQFEVGRGEVGKGGVVRDEEKHRRVVDEIKAFSIENGYISLGTIPSPILGPKGNREFFIYLKRNDAF
ncbi:MAG: TlyA family RNA methyltransferase [Deltaproteobacteria bacterium]|uniref:TlyA family RNA methyltransferase n=1 Tax=Candidatus Zymogenus saltonus TaxID=2844893 RepID=A0A9D8KCS5_9DELT|nr:TlyA family RNA methyltransferase [Candidatus Zymogenus saltonus]